MHTNVALAQLMVDKRCVITRTVQFSGNHQKYYIGWALAISCCLTSAYQTFRGACCLRKWAGWGDTHIIYARCKIEPIKFTWAAEKTMVNSTCENQAIKMDLLLQWTWLVTLQPAYITWVHPHTLHFHLLNIRSIP